MGTLWRLSTKSRLLAAVLLVCWLLLPVAVGGERNRVAAASHNPLRSNGVTWGPDQRLFGAMPWSAEWNPGKNVLRDGLSSGVAVQPAGDAASDGELPKQMAVVPECVTSNPSGLRQPAVNGVVGTVSGSGVKAAGTGLDQPVPKRLSVVPEGSIARSLASSSAAGDRVSQLRSPSRAPLPRQDSESARANRALAAAQAAKPSVSAPQRPADAQVAQGAMPVRTEPQPSAPSAASIKPPVLLAEVPRQNASAPQQGVGVPVMQFVSRSNVRPPAVNAGCAPVRQPLVLAQAPRAIASAPRPAAGVCLAQAVTEPAQPMEVIPERPLPVIDVTGGDVIPVDENMPLTDVQPQMWMSCESGCRCGVMCPDNRCRRTDHRWGNVQMIPWQVFAQGEYVGPARSAHVPVYRLRVDDMIRMVYGFTGQPSPTPYRLAVGDVIQVESNGDPKVDRSVTVQPDGMVTLRYLGQVRAAGHSLEGLQKDLESRYAKFIREPAISLMPVKLNSRVEELRQAVDQRYGRGGQGVYVRVTPAGTVQLPSIGSIPVQGLTLEEVKREIEARYASRFWGVEVTPTLDERAPRYLFVLGEVRNPGRYELQGPTTAMQAIAMAGGWNVGAELRQAVVFRRDDYWRLMATKLHLCGAVRGTHPCPADEIWLRDSDILLVPKSRILETDDMIELLFTRGLYGVVPFNMSVSWTRLTAL